MTAPTPQDHTDTAVQLLAQAAADQASGKVSAANAGVARAQVHALLAVAGHLAPAPAPEPVPEPPIEEPPIEEPITEGP